MEILSLEAPEPLSAGHRVEGFSGGVPALDEWLNRRAWNNQRTGASRTYVVAAAGQVAGYYCLASGALALREAPGCIRRNMPDPVPMAILGRLAVDRSRQGQGVGVALLRDAFERTRPPAEFADCWCMPYRRKPRPSMRDMDSSHRPPDPSHSCCH